MNALIADPAHRARWAGHAPTRALADTGTMLRRNLKHMRRSPSITLMVIGQPVVFLLLFVYVFGSTMGAGLAGPGGGRGEYLAYVTPAILVMTVASVSAATAVWVASDMATGIVTRLRTMAVARASLLAGHVLAAVVQTALAVAVVLATALLLGFRSPAGPAAWTAFAGVLAMATLATTWLTIALGLAAKTVEAASNTPMVLLLLPFLGSGFTPTDSMPAWLRWFAEYQPFTPIIDTLRGLLTAAPVGDSAALATGWCVLITAASYVWARHLFATRAPR